MLSTPPLQHRLFRVQHLQKQPHSRIHPDLIQQSRPCHPTVLSLQGHWFHLEIAKQPHQHADEFDLRELAPRAAARAAGPADEGTVASGQILEVLHWM